MILTDRLLIERVRNTIGDAEVAAIVSWLNDKKAMVFSDQRFFNHTLESERDYIKRQNRDFHLWAVRCRADNTLIGTISAHFDMTHDVADVGILLGPQYRSQGYGREAWYGVVDWLLEHECIKVECGFMSGNVSMMMLARKRMRFEGERPRHFLGADGARHSLIMFGSR